MTATISDPSAGYVAFVEVAPDGSSSLLEQQGAGTADVPPEPAEHGDVRRPSDPWRYPAFPKPKPICR